MNQNIIVLGYKNLDYTNKAGRQVSGVSIVYCLADRVDTKGKQVGYFPTDGFISDCRGEALFPLGVPCMARASFQMGQYNGRPQVNLVGVSATDGPVEFLEAS